MKYVTVYTATDRFEAENVAAQLRSSGLFPIVAADDAGGTGPNLAFVQRVPVRVAETKADAAHEILESS